MLFSLTGFEAATVPSPSHAIPAATVPRATMPAPASSASSILLATLAVLLLLPSAIAAAAARPSPTPSSRSGASRRRRRRGHRRDQRASAPATACCCCRPKSATFDRAARRSAARCSPDQQRRHAGRRAAGRRSGRGAAGCLPAQPRLRHDLLRSSSLLSTVATLVLYVALRCRGLKLGRPAAACGRRRARRSSMRCAMFYGAGLRSDPVGPGACSRPAFPSAGVMPRLRARLQPAAEPLQPRLRNHPPELLREAPQADFARPQRPRLHSVGDCMPSCTRVISSVSSALTRRLMRQLR